MDFLRLLFFFIWIQFVFTLENLALHKAATMNTSQHTDKWLAGAAVDGNTDQTLEGNSCAVTSDNYNPEAWWKVDLGTISSIEKVKIYYRDENDGSSYTYRLSGFYIYVSNDSVSLGSSCYVNNNGIQANPGPNSITSFPCIATGRYVTIYKSRKDVCKDSIVNENSCAQLELCEVKILGVQGQIKATTILPTSAFRDEHVGQRIENFALHKATMMSTSQHTDKWLAGAAVDGNTNQTLEGNSCTVTSDNYKPEAWWKVDLGVLYNIHEVKIYYRDEKDVFTEDGAQMKKHLALQTNCYESSSYTYRLSGFYIYVSNDSVSLGSSCYVNNNGEQANPGPNTITSFPCVATGRYVTIYKSRKNVCKDSIVNKNSCAQLELCEVQVLGYVYIDKCPQKCLNKICDSGNRCYDCEDGYTGAFCNVLCKQGKYGRNCSQICNSVCEKGSCHYETGECATNCAPGRKGKYCDEVCGYKEYGIDCLRTCGHCLDEGCSAETGICLNGCISGWTGPSCSSSKGNQLTAVVIVLSVGLAIVTAINVLMIIKPGLFPCRHGNNNSRNQNRNGKGTQAARSGTIEVYDNTNMNYDSIVTESENSHTYTALQTNGQQH